MNETKSIMKNKRKIASSIGVKCYLAMRMSCKLFDKKSTEADSEKYLPEIQSLLYEALAAVLTLKELCSEGEAK